MSGASITQDQLKVERLCVRLGDFHLRDVCRGGMVQP